MPIILRRPPSSFTRPIPDRDRNWGEHFPAYRADGHAAPEGLALTLNGGAAVGDALVTDTREAVLLDVASGRELGRGLRAIPAYAALAGLAAPVPPLSDEALDRERRILFAYSEFLSGGCCQGACRPNMSQTEP